MPTVSLCMIVRNEEEVIARCLASVADLVDEIVIVDTGSTDRTKELVAAFTDKVYDFTWIDDFAVARNYAFDLGSMDYCMWLDADDVLLEEDRRAFRRLKERLVPDVNAVMMKYNTGFDENGNVTFSYYRERLIKNGVGMRWVGAVHEVVPTFGKTIYDHCAVTHSKLRPSDPERNLRIFESQIAKGERLDSRQQFYYGRELYYHKRYRDAIRVFEAFLDSGEGWLENVLDACAHCAYCYYGLGLEEEALRALLRSFVYDTPRAEQCCDLGKHFYDRRRYHQAIYWYSRALECHRDDSRGGFTAPDCYGYIPCIQLCVCYDALGDKKKAQLYNELAAKHKPDSPAVAANRQYFAET